MPLARRTLLALPLMLPVAARARPRLVFTEMGAAIRGYDAVAYFTQGRPVQGQAAIRHAWQGATWYFASTANRDLFAASPTRYAPNYGGFCAWAVSEGYDAPTDPYAWTIVGDRLFLNYNLAIQRQWEADIPGRIARGDANWPAVAALLAAH